MQLDHFAFPKETYKDNHCVVYAFAHLAGYTTRAQVKELAKVAKRTPRRGILFENWEKHTLSDGGVRFPLLTLRGSGFCRRWGDADLWCELVGLVLVGPPHEAQGERFSLEDFVDAHPTGKYIVCTNGHAQAVIEGDVWGYYTPTDRVELWYEVAPKGGD